eukprot:TRINITY_DN5217_c0_g1_i2.p1 TRINITY_DN5217_c0_g1~~TRINITY_DN5217_c0_g1_i2.p1  ORF type:complete len:427 (+),score=105.71 TRINITY_DN5217_c0_g1_i2:176-1456(+)
MSSTLGEPSDEGAVAATLNSVQQRKVLLQAYQKNGQKLSSLPVRPLEPEDATVKGKVTFEEVTGISFSVALESFREASGVEPSPEQIKKINETAHMVAVEDFKISEESISRDPPPFADPNGDNDSDCSDDESPAKYEVSQIQNYTASRMAALIDEVKENPPSSTGTLAFYAGKQGFRNYMEDRVCVVPSLNAMAPAENQVKDPIDFFGVYDGHGGYQAAEYCGLHLHHVLARDPLLQTDPSKALTKAFEFTDRHYCVKSKANTDSCGTTATVALRKGNTVFVANAGDSPAILSRDGLAMTLNAMHHPDVTSEKERIVNSGGVVVWFGVWRVNGCLAVSRAIGDRVMKEHVISEPFVTSVDITPQDEFLILCSDGVTESIQPQELVDAVNNSVQNGVALDKIPQEVVDLAVSRGSTDNCSCCILFFP